MLRAACCVLCAACCVLRAACKYELAFILQHHLHCDPLLLHREQDALQLHACGAQCAAIRRRVLSVVVPIAQFFSTNCPPASVHLPAARTPLCAEFAVFPVLIVQDLSRICSYSQDTIGVMTDVTIGVVLVAMHLMV